MGNPTVEKLVWAFIGAFLGLFVGSFFTQPLERLKRKAKSWWRSLSERVGFVEDLAAEQDEFRIGKLRTKWVVCQGSAEYPYTPQNIICLYDPTPLVLPQDREQRRTEIAEEQSKLKSEGERHYHNGPTLALARISPSQSGEMEEPMLFLKVRPSDYFTHRATALSLNDPIETKNGKTTTVRDKYIRGTNYSHPIPEFANAISINFAVLTSDDWIVVCKRSTDVGIDANFMASAVNQCVNPASDRDTSGTITPLATVKRGASNELHIEVSDDEVVFFTVGVDTRWYFYELTGCIRTKFSRDDIRARLSQGSSESWEAENFYFIKNDPVEVARFLNKSDDKWTPYGIVSLLQTLISEFGTHAVEKALKKYPPSTRVSD